MTTIREDDFIQSVADAFQFISYYHPVDYIRSLAEAYQREASPAAKDAMAQILINSRMAAEGHRPICQDTGIAIAFVRVGMDVRWDTKLSLQQMVDEGVRRAYTDRDNPLRASVLADPDGKRVNTRDNTPAVVHVELVPGDTVEVIVAAKGGGSENKSKFAMLLPNDSVVDWVLSVVPTMGADWCPPGILSLGIGGTPEKAMLLAKWGMMDPIDIQQLIARGPSNRAEELRLELYDKVNALGIGAQGLGGLSTVLDVKVNDWPTHAVSKPVALLPNCAATRHAHFVLDGSGPAKLEPPSLDDWPRADDGLSRRAAASNLDTLTKAEIAGVESRRAPAAVRQASDRTRCRAPAHDGDARARRAAARRLHEPLHLLRGPGRPGARRGGRPRGPDDVVTHGQVHRRDAREDRPHRHDRQVGARADRRSMRSSDTAPSTASRSAALRISCRRRSRRPACSRSRTSAWKRSTSSRSRTCR